MLVLPHLNSCLSVLQVNQSAVLRDGLSIGGSEGSVGHVRHLRLVVNAYQLLSGVVGG